MCMEDTEREHLEAFNKQLDCLPFHDILIPDLQGHRAFLHHPTLDHKLHKKCQVLAKMAPVSLSLSFSFFVWGVGLGIFGSVYVEWHTKKVAVTLEGKIMTF